MHRSRHLPLLLLALIACHRPAEKPATGGALTVVNPSGDRPTFFDLGRVPFGRRAEHVFRIRNDEGRTVTVHDLLPSCGCASAKLSVPGKTGATVGGNAANHEADVEIPAGAVAELTVSIDTQQVQVINKDKLAQVRMRSDSASSPYLTFEVHLIAERAMRAVPAEIELGQTPRSAGKSGQTTVSTEKANSRVRVLGIESVEGPFTATADPAEMAGERVWIVVASAKPGLEPGPVSGKVVLSVSEDDGTGTGTPFQIPVRAQIAEDVVLLPPVFLFGTFARGKGASKEVELDALVPGEKVKVTGTSVAAMPEGAAAEIAAEATPVDPDGDGRAAKWKIVLRASEKLAEGAFSGTLKIALDHPRVPEIRAAFSGVNGRAE
jgi:hypothetical protein